MNMMGADTWIQLGGLRHGVDDILKGTSGAGKDEFEKEVIQFCRDWYSGTREFKLTTSGSTGAPKEITFRREQLEASAMATQNALGLQRGETALLCLDPRYIAGKMMLVRSFVTGMNLVAFPPNANPFLSIDANLRIDFTALVPYQVQAILGSPSDALKLDTLKSVLIGGAALDFTLRAQLAAFKPAIYATYGMTETISHVALQKINLPCDQDYFEVLPGIKIEKDDRGCLTIEAAYLGSELIHTNDLVDLVGDGRFIWLGRLDSVINTGGVKVIPEKIEKEIARVLASLQIRNRFFVAGLPDVLLGSKVMLIIEGDAKDREPLMMERLRKILGKFEMPKDVLYVPVFVETGTQKINRRETLNKLNTKN